MKMRASVGLLAYTLIVKLRPHVHIGSMLIYQGWRCLHTFCRALKVLQSLCVLVGMSLRVSEGLFYLSSYKSVRNPKLMRFILSARHSGEVD